MTNHVTHVIFDLDGVLLDTETIFIQAQREIFARFGMTLPESVRARMMGQPTWTAVPWMLEQTGLPMTADEFIAERAALTIGPFSRADAMPGAMELTAHLRAHGVPQAIATSSSREMFAHKSQSAPDWFASFDAIVTSDDVEHGKPAPDIFLRAAALLGAPPEACLVFEDAPAGVQAALAAGMRVVALPAPDHVSMIEGAHAILDGFAAFEPEAWGLPAYG